MSNTRTVNGPGFRIRYDDEPGYLRALVFDGIDSQAVSTAMWRMLLSECHAVDAQRLLVVEDLRGEVPQEELGELVEALQSLSAPGLRVAFVELSGGEETNQLIEIMCRERGIDGRCFINEDEARRWLVYGS